MENIIDVFYFDFTVIYTIEFQKRGLPHAHILIFLHPQFKHPNPDGIDKIISAELPDEQVEPELFKIVSSFMIHGPCGIQNKNSPCIDDNGKCTKFFPNFFCDKTTVDADGYPVYRRRDDGRVIKKGNAFVHNGFVVPYNKHLLMKYNAHINVEWCNQSRSIKYLFKYINKGHDRITASFYKGSPDQEHNGLVDEIKLYYDCRYLSSCEASWILFAFHISYREPSVERLPFHLENEHYVTFYDHERIDNVLDKENSKNSKFLAWMDANKKYPMARELTYNEFPSKFVWNEKKKHWNPRKRGFKIGRIYFVHPGSGQLYYLRTLLNYCKGPTSFEDIKTVNNVVLKTFKDACYARGL